MNLTMQRDSRQAEPGEPQWSNLYRAEVPLSSGTVLVEGTSDEVNRAIPILEMFGVAATQPVRTDSDGKVTVVTYGSWHGVTQAREELIRHGLIR